jgi:hypothetical protein
MLPRLAVPLCVLLASCRSAAPELPGASAAPIALSLAVGGVT